MTTDQATENGLDHDVLTGAASLLATTLGVSGEPGRGEQWPIDLGQTSLTVDFAGPVSGSLYLSIAEAEAQRFVDDPDAADELARQLLQAMGLDPATVDVSGIRPADDLPFLHVVVRGDEGIVGFGATVASGADDASTGSADASNSPAAAAAAYEPAPVSGASPVGSSMGAPITLLADVDMDVTVELGRASVPVRELLSLQPGMVLELDRQAGAPIDVLVNGRLIARGEVVVLDEQFGLRVTEIVASGKSGLG